MQYTLSRLPHGDRAGAALNLDRALGATDALFAALRRGESGKWTAWYIGECMIGVEHSRDLLRVSRAAARGEPAPPVRVPNQYWQQYLDRRQSFRQNFPLLYAPKPSELSNATPDAQRR